jgi:hypothetical protein
VPAQSWPLSGDRAVRRTGISEIDLLSDPEALLDPNTAPLRALPREDRDLFIAANNSHQLAFDNVSGLPAWISDTLCRLATGGGFAVRQLYSDQDEVLFDAARPVILNGIEDIVTRPDLADRAVVLTLEPIPEERRRPEAELWAAFEAERPCILGVLLDTVAQGLKRLPETRLERLPSSHFPPQDWHRDRIRTRRPGADPHDSHRHHSEPGRAGKCRCATVRVNPLKTNERPTRTMRTQIDRSNLRQQIQAGGRGYERGTLLRSEQSLPATLVAVALLVDVARAPECRGGCHPFIHIPR